MQDDASTLQLDSALGASSSVYNSDSAAESTPQSPRGPPDSPTTLSEKAESAAGTATAAPSAQNSAGTGSSFMRVVAHLGRLSVHASARAAEECWPPASVSEPHERHEPSPVDMAGMVDEERPLISIIAEGGLLKYQQACLSLLPPVQL